jgi:uncharacterized membrane protein
MAHQAHIHHVSPTSLPAIHEVGTDRPWQWLAAGWSDFTKAPGISLAYGSVITIIMLAVFYILQTSAFYAVALSLMAGFVFVGPVLAVGMYEISRRLEQRQPVSLYDTWSGWKRNSKSVLAIGVVMLLMLLTWFMLSAEATAMVYGISGNVGPLLGTSVDWQTFAFSVRMPMAMSFGIVGLIAVSITFVMTVASVPMLTEHEDMDLITAIVTSAQAVRTNTAALALWAGLIALFTGMAVAPLFLGLIIVFPLLAYASWHAYRDLIEHCSYGVGFSHHRQRVPERRPFFVPWPSAHPPVGAYASGLFAVILNRIIVLLVTVPPSQLACHLRCHWVSRQRGFG